MTRDGPIPHGVPETVDSETLRQWIESGSPLSVLDVRPLKDRAEWSIPGSVHIDAYEALWAHDPHALDSLTLPHGRPVVTVCALGQTSLIASALLRSRGILAYSLEGGMRAWSGAWNTAEVPGPRADNRVIQVRRTGKGCISYMTGSAGEAVVIDASVEPEVYLGIARDNGWRISSLVETHVHADHVSRARALSLSTGARIFIPAQNRVTYPHVAVFDKDRLPIGAHPDLFTAIRTPGHTMESTCYLLAGTILFTGDTLFLGSVGRPDLEGGLAEAESRARDLHRSLGSLCALPEGTLILPAHTAVPVPFDGIPLCATLGQVMKQNPFLGMHEDAFVSSILAHIPATPSNFLRILESNETGVFPDGDIADLEGGSNRCAIA